MAKSKAKLASSKPVSTKWLQNAMRSIGVSTKNVLKTEFAPNLYEVVEAGIGTSKSVINTLRRNSGGTNQLSQQLQNNKYVKFAQTAYKNALSDLKSGNLNNEDRFGDSVFGDFDFDNMDSLFDDSGFSFGDDEADSINVNVVNATNNNDAMFAMTTHLQKQTEATLKTSQANMNAMIAINSAAMMQNQQTSSLIVSGLDAINKNISSLVEYNNSNMNRFIESSMAFYEKMGSKFDKDESGTGSQKVNASNVFNGSSGGINIGQYKQYIKQQFKDTLSKTGLGMAAGLIDDNMLEMAVSNPLGFATEGLVKFMVPKMLTNTIKGVEETFSSFMPSLLHKLSEWGEGYATGALGHAKQFIGKTFGLKIDRNNKINKAAHIEKGAIPFDGQTKHAITEIITKELREQTFYLKTISNHFDRKNTSRVKDDSEVFDYNTGTYIKSSKVTENILTEIKDAIIGSMNSGSFGKTLRGYGKNLEDPSQQEAFNHMLDEFMLRLEKHGSVVKMNDAEFKNKDSEYSKLLASLSGDKYIKKRIDEALKDMVATNPNAVMDMSRTMLTARNSRNNILKEIESNPSEYNLYAATGLDGKNLDDLIFEMMKNQETKPVITNKDKDKSKTLTAKELKDKAFEKIFGKKTEDSKSDGTFGKMLNRTSEGISQMATGIIHGSSDEAISKFTSMMGDQFRLLWSKFNESFMTPIKKSLLGTKNEDTGFSEGGIFSGVTNGFKDATGMLSHYITGKDFKDSKGNTHTIEEGGSSVVGNLKKIGKQVKEGVMEKLFGPKSVDKDGKLTEDKKGGILSGFKDSIKEGLVGWKEALFGKKIDEKDHKQVSDDIIKTIKERLPDAATGGAIGAGVGLMAGGSLLGTLIGGPIGGAALGTAVGFIARSEKFQNFLFGEKDKDGNRIGGVISKKVQDYFKENKNTAVGGAAVGAVTGTITGGGLLGTLVGGPIAGALMGMGTSLLLKNEKFKEFLFGDEEKGQAGILTSIKNKLKSFGQGKDGDASGGKLGGMTLVGAAGGGLIGSLFGGPILGSVIGLSSSILAQKDNFHEWFFGKTDEKGNKKEGVLGKFKNMLTVNVFRPMSNMFKDIGSDFMTFLKYDVLQRASLILEPVVDFASNTFSKITKSTTDAVISAGKYIKENFLDNIIKNTANILKPLTGAVKAVTKGVYSIGKSIVAAPLKLLSAITSPIAQSVGRVVTGVAKTAFKGVDLLLVKPINNLVLKPLGAVAKGLGKIVSAPFILLGKVANKLNSKLTGFVAHLGNFTKRIGVELKSFIKNSAVGRWMERRKEDMKDFTQHVKDAAIEFVSPLTDFVKVTIKSVGQHIKDTISKATKGIGSWISKTILGLFGKKKEDGKPKKESRLARIWRETAPGQRSEDAAIDPDAPLSEKLSSWKTNWKNEREKNKQAAAERKKLEKNEKLIAKYTGNQRADWTEENKRLAEYEAKKKGVIINWEDVETRKTEEEEVRKATLEVETETRDYTKEIADFLMGRIKKDPAIEKKEQLEKGMYEGEAIAKRDAEIAETKLNAETKSDRKSVKKAEEAQADARKKESEARQEDMAKNLAGKDETGMSFLDGLKANWARVTGHWKGLKSSKEDDKLATGDSVELNPEALADGEEVKKVSVLSKLLGRFKGKGHAKGTNDTGDEAAVVGEAGPELVNFSEGNQVFANNKPLAVVITGMTNKVKSGLFGFLKKKPHSTETDTDSGDVRSIAARVANIGGSDASGIISSLNGGKAGEELEDDLHAATTMIEADKRLDKAHDAGYTAVERQAIMDKEEEKARFASIEKNTREQADAQKEFSFNWSSIFSKKGLITAGLLLATPLIIKAIPSIIKIGKQIGEFIGNIGKRFGWTMENGALGDGDTVVDKVDENTDRLVSLIDPDKSFKERISGFVKNEDGQLDHQSDANAKLLVSAAGEGLFRLGGGKRRLKKTLRKSGIRGVTDIVKNVGKITYSVDDVARAMGTNADDVIKTFGKKTRFSAADIGKVMGSSTDEVVEFMHDAGKNAAKVTTTKNKGLLSKMGSAIANTKPGKAVTGAVSKAGGAIKNTAKAAVTKGKDAIVGAGAKIANSKAGKAVGGAATKLVDNTSSILKTVLSKVTTWIDDVIRAVGKKMGKELGEGIISGLLKRMTDVVTKFFSKIAAKIAAIFTKEGAIAASNAAFGAGIIIKATEITLSAINGATGAARLFRVDPEYVDGKMTTISTILGAAQGTMVGSIIDVINELFCSVTGVDFLSELATMIYNAWAGDEKAAALKAGKEEFQNKYTDYQDKELTKQYETAKKAGLIAGGVSYDDYKQGVKDGKYEAKYDSFADFNDKEHKTLGAKIGKGIGKGFKAIGKGIGSATSFVFGKNKKHFEDDKGNKYYDNKDGTYQVVSALGEDLGYISKEALPKSVTEKKERKKGIFEKRFDKVKSIFADSKETVYYATDGTYYDGKGKHYAASGEKLGKITTDELQTMIVSGVVTKGEINKEAGIKRLGKTISTGVKALGKGIATGWNKFKDGASKVGKSIKDGATKVWNKASSIFNKGVNKVKGIFVDTKETVYYATDGSYYDSNGNQYSASGEKLDKITTDELQTLIVSGVVTKGEINKESSVKQLGKTISSGVKALGNGIATGWSKFKEGASKVGKSIKDGATKLWNKASSFLSSKGTKLKEFLTTKTTTGWYDANGGYYVLNGEAYDYYNANGDKLSSGVSLVDVVDLIQSGTLTEGEVRVDRKLTKAIKALREARNKVFDKIKSIGGPVLDSIGKAGSKLWENIKKDGLFGGVSKFFKKETSTVWYDPNGNYYKLNGDTYDYYNANNDVISSGIEASIVQEKMTAGLLTEGTVTTDSEAKKAISKIKESVSDAWKKAKETVSSGWSKFTSWLTGGKGGSIAHMTSSNYGDKSIMDGSSSLYDLNIGGPRNKSVKGIHGLNIGGSVTAQDVLSQYIVSSNYGNRTINGNQELHAGIDLSSTVNSPVSSFTPGTVYKVVNGITPNTGNLNSTDGGGFGNYVVVKDDKGNYNYYAHMNGTSVKQGDTVEIGDKLGILGHTGRSTGPHLHYEIRKNPNASGTAENTYNPTAYLDGNISNNTSSTGSKTSITDIFSKLSGFFTEFGNRALTGAITGKFDTDYTSYFADSSDESSSSASVDSSNYVKINTTESAKKIWNYYKSRGIPDNTIAGILGNMQAESGLNPRNLQNSYEKSLGHTDDSYTTDIDSGKYTNFVKDSAGYGLVQWTYHSLKKALLDYAKKKGSSIGDLDMQLEFLIKQLSEDYPNTWEKMLSASSPEEASTIMLKEFEKPAVLNTNTRAGYARQYFDTLTANNGQGGTSIKPRIIKRKANKTTAYGGPAIEYTDSTLRAVSDYNTANIANKYINSTSDGNMTKAVNMIISLLEAITGNTASTSSKLDMLENLKKSNVVKGGDTINNITNTDNSKSSSNPRDILATGSGTKVSRNQRLAEKIALGA